MHNRNEINKINTVDVLDVETFITRRPKNMLHFVTDVESGSYSGLCSAGAATIVSIQRLTSLSSTKIAIL